VGNYDNVICKYPLPNTKKEIQDSIFQTKSLDCNFEDYTITEDGCLIRNEFVLELVPEEQRYYYGKPEWNEHKLSKLVGSLKKVPTKDVRIQYNGVLDIITCIDHKCFSYYIYFNNGKLESLEIII
jgi:hypothetical protein